MKWLLAALLIVNGAVFTWIVLVDRKQQQIDPTAAFNDRINQAYKLKLVGEVADTIAQKSPEAPLETTPPIATVETDNKQAQPQPSEKESSASTPTLEDLNALQEQLATLANLVKEQQKTETTATAEKDTTIKAAPVFSTTAKQADKPETQPPVKQAPQPVPPKESELSVSFAPQNCFTLGPFAETVERDRIADLLGNVDITTSIRTTSQQRTTGYWVYLPPFSTRQQARDTVVILQQKGIKDFLIIPRGEKKNAISLGLFSGLDTAQRRISQLKKIGIAAQFKENQTTSKFFWLDFASPHEDPLPKSIKDKILTKSGGIGVLNRPCS